MTLLRRWLIGFGLFLGMLLCSVVGCCFLFPAAFFDFMNPPLKQVSRSPATLGSVVLLEECIPFCFGGTTIWLFVRDGAARPDPIRFDIFASDGQDKWERGVWSKDGTVFAVVAHLGVGGGKNLEKDFGAFFVSAYDFRTHRRIPPRTQRVPARLRSKRIATLLRQRGGQGSSVFPRPYMKLGSPLAPWERGQYGVLDGWN